MFAEKDINVKTCISIFYIIMNIIFIIVYYNFFIIKNKRNNVHTKI